MQSMYYFKYLKVSLSKILKKKYYYFHCTINLMFTVKKKYFRIINASHNDYFENGKLINRAIHKIKIFQTLKKSKRDIKIIRNRRFELSFKIPHQFTHIGHEKGRSTILTKEM